MSHPPRRIALVTPYDYSYPGGVNEHVRYLGHHLRQRGHLVHVLAPASEPVDDPDFVRLADGTLSIPTGGSIARVTLSPTVWGEARDVLRRGHYDVVHVHEPVTPFISPAVLYHSRAVNVGTFHTYRDSASLYEFARPIVRYFMKRLHGRIAVSRAARSLVDQAFPGEYRIIPNGIEVAEFQSPDLLPFEEYRAEGMLNILFMGRLERRKGFRYLLRAFREVKEKLPTARLIVAGAYEKEDRLPFVRYVRHFRIRDVKFVGKVSAADKVRWFRTADLFCAPSTGGESFGIVLTEAMAAGAPVVASNIPGYRGVIQDGVSGLLVPPEDEDALAATILRLLGDAGMRATLRERALREVRRFDWHRVSGEVEDYYEELLARRVADTGRLAAPV